MNRRELFFGTLLAPLIKPLAKLLPRPVKKWVCRPDQAPPWGWHPPLHANCRCIDGMAQALARREVGMVEDQLVHVAVVEPDG